MTEMLNSFFNTSPETHLDPTATAFTLVCHFSQGNSSSSSVIQRLQLNDGETQFILLLITNVQYHPGTAQLLLNTY